MSVSPASLTASSDVRREIPRGAGGRRDRIEAALATLGAESRRLERLGLELPTARCHEQRRYWMFLSALFALPGSAIERFTPRADASWPGDRIR